MSIDLYLSPVASQCHSIQMLGATLGIKINPIILDTAAGEHLRPSFVALNPQHTVPTLVDSDGFVVWETRAILVYLAEKYGGGASKQSLYPPQDVARRARINQLLYFVMGTLYKAFGDAHYGMFFGGAPATEEQKQKLETAFGFLNQFLKGERYVAGGEGLSVADISLFSTVAMIERLVGYKREKFPNVVAWHQRQRAEIKGVEISVAGLDGLWAYAQAKLVEAAAAAEKKE